MWLLILSRRRCGRRSPTCGRARTVYRAGVHHPGAGVPDGERRAGRDRLSRGRRAPPMLRRCCARRRRPERALAVAIESSEAITVKPIGRSGRRKRRCANWAALFRRCSHKRRVRSRSFSVAISAEPNTALSLTLDDSKRRAPCRRRWKTGGRQNGSRCQVGDACAERSRHDAARGATRSVAVSLPARPDATRLTGFARWRSAASI